MSETDYAALLAQLEKDTREGRNEIVVAKLRKIATKDLPRPIIGSLADLAYRTNQFLLALKFLKPIVQPKAPLVIAATLKENVIYATSLLHLGAVEEANSLLKTLDPTKDPEIYLHRAFANFAEWKYGAAVPLLQKFINSHGLASYRRLVGMVNLSAAYVFSGQLSQAEKLLSKTRSELQQQGHQLLFGNTLELTAQLFLLKKDYPQAEMFLQQAEKVLSDTPGRYLFYVKKGFALVELMKSKGSPASLAVLNLLRAEAGSMKQWETLRDCDLFESLATQNEKLIQKVLLGTPHASYKKRVLSLAEQKLVAPGKFKIDFLISPSEKKFIFEIAQFQNQDPLAMKSKPILYKLLQTLTSDFYKPQRLGFVFSKIYPGDRFDPVHSPHRIFNGLHQLNKWFKANHVPLKVTVLAGEFHLKPLANITLSFSKPRVQQTKSKFDLEQLHLSMGLRTFNSAQAAKSLRISKPTLLHIVKSGITAKKIRKIGTGPGTLYRFIKIGQAA